MLSFFEVFEPYWDQDVFDAVISSSNVQYRGIFSAAAFSAFEILGLVYEKADGKIDVNRVGGIYGTAL